VTIVGTILTQGRHVTPRRISPRRAR